MPFRDNIERGLVFIGQFALLSTVDIKCGDTSLFSEPLLIEGKQSVVIQVTGNHRKLHIIVSLTN